MRWDANRNTNTHTHASVAYRHTGTFYNAEDYHQDYLDVNPNGYCSHKKYWDDK